MPHLRSCALPPLRVKPTQLLSASHAARTCPALFECRTAVTWVVPAPFGHMVYRALGRLQLAMDLKIQTAR